MPATDALRMHKKYAISGEKYRAITTCYRSQKYMCQRHFTLNRVILHWFPLKKDHAYTGLMHVEPPKLGAFTSLVPWTSLSVSFRPLESCVFVSLELLP